MSKILIVEDEESIAELEKDYLELSGFEVEIENNGTDGLERALKEEYDLLILDLMLPGTDGFEICRRVREVKNTPIIMVSAKKEDIDKIRGLGLGADDYITKPFEMVELLASVESVLRRYHKSEERIEVDDVIIDIPSRTVTRQGEAVKLTLKEFELLLFLVRNRNIALYRETIYENIWQSEYMGDGRTVDLHIQRLRKKLHWEDRIHTVYKVGYRFT